MTALINGDKMRQKLVEILTKTNGNEERIKNSNGGKNKDDDGQISYSRAFIRDY